MLRGQLRRQERAYPGFIKSCGQSTLVFHCRLEQFLKRYTEWDDPSSETPPYHYGTHYSSAMIVSSYMV
jgi:hypothetical protein